ncbi:hypothetical protein C5S42_13105 [Candidatus Methanomarinus sp.]|nr:hypothetical protein C5S42_13105 [ANME-2 cluster archaeon]
MITDADGFRKRKWYGQRRRKTRAWSGPGV